MRLSALALLVSSLACAPQGVAQRPPTGSFYFPSGIALARDGSTGPVLYVASANIDRRFDFGTVIAVPLSAIGLPPIGQTPAAPLDIRDLKLSSSGINQVLISSYAGELGAWPIPGGGVRLFIPARSENNYLHVLNAGVGGQSLDSLSCAFNDSSRDCSMAALSLTKNDLAKGALSRFRAPQPFGVTVASPSSFGGAQTYVTHLVGADYPAGSFNNVQSYLVHFDPASPPEPTRAFDESLVIGLGADPAASVAVGERYLYLTGRFVSGLADEANLLRLVDRSTGAVVNLNVEASLHALEDRGIALTRNAALDEEKLFIITRTPEMLLVAKMAAATSSQPGLSILRLVPLPPGSNQVGIIERPASGSLPARGPLVVIAATNDLFGSDVNRGMVVIYDDEVGQLVARVEVGAQPYGLAIDTDATARTARIFVSNFGDGRISVLDLPSIDDPQGLALIAHLGTPQVCVSNPTDPVCGGAP